MLFMPIIAVIRHCQHAGQHRLLLLLQLLRMQTMMETSLYADIIPAWRLCRSATAEDCLCAYDIYGAFL